MFLLNNFILLQSGYFKAIYNISIIFKNVKCDLLVSKCKTIRKPIDFLNYKLKVL